MHVVHDLQEQLEPFYYTLGIVLWQFWASGLKNFGFSPWVPSVETNWLNIFVASL